MNMILKLPQRYIHMDSISIMHISILAGAGYGVIYTAAIRCWCFAKN